MDFLKKLKPIFIAIGIILAIIYFTYFSPKQNALNTIEKFENYCVKNKYNLIYKSIPLIIDIGNPWRYETPDIIVYNSTKDDSLFSTILPSIIPFISSIKTFTSLELDDNYQYNFKRNMVFYCLKNDTLFYDEFDIDWDKWNSGNWTDSDIDSLGVLYQRVFNKRENKVVKNKNSSFEFYYMKDEKYKNLGILISDFRYSILFNGNKKLP